MITSPAFVGNDQQDEIASLVRQLHETQKRLREMTGGEIDAVLLPDGQSYLLHEAQAQLQSSEATQRHLAETQVAILNALPANIALVDSHGTILSTNESWRRFATANALHGPEFAVGENYLDVCERATGNCSEEARATAAGIRRVLNKEVADFTMEYPCHSPTEKRWFLLRVSPMHEDKSGGAVVMHINITEQKLAAQEFEELSRRTDLRERLLSTALASMRDFAQIYDRSGRILFANQPLLDLWGLTLDQVVGRNFIELGYPVDLAQKLNMQLQKVFETGQEVTDETPYKSPTGVEGYYEYIFSPALSADGTVDFVIGSTRDVTLRKQEEAEVRFNEQRYRSLVQATTAIVWDTPASGEFTVEQPGWTSFTGQTFEELRGTGWLNAIHPEDRAETARVWSEAVTNRSRYTVEHRIQTPDKTYRNMFVRAVPILGEDGTIRQWIGIHTDITERKQLENQFLRAQRMESIGTLAGGIAHDLNNILAPILMAIDLLKLTATDPQAKDLLQTIGVSAKRGADIVRQVLSFARGVEGDRIEVQPQHLIADLENIIKDTFPKNIRLQFSLPEKPWMILGDPTQIHQILLNLCVNARDAMPHGGTLTVNLENCVLDEHYVAMNLQAKAGNYVQIGVTDTGMGMPPDILNKIFEPFFTTKGPNEGTGLGLSTVMAIVKSHGGNVNVYSEQGKGTTFRIYLPAAETSPGSAKTQTQDLTMPLGNGETILVIDDEASILDITTQTLTAFGYRVLCATDGAEAIALYAENKKNIALVLTDMAMPIMDGAAVIRALLRINPAVTIIAASGLKVTGDVTQIPAGGIKHFLMKPYTSGTLLKSIRSVLADSIKSD